MTLDISLIENLLQSHSHVEVQPVLSDDNRVLEPPDPFPNSEVKQYIADGSVGLPHVRVGHRQAFITKRLIPTGMGLFYCPPETLISFLEGLWMF